MIATPADLLCLGRSGTGKTTSSALRLFSSDALYKYTHFFNEFKEKKESKDQKFRINPDFVSQKTNFRLVFVTASPVLCNEVSKFYDEMKDTV